STAASGGNLMARDDKPNYGPIPVRAFTDNALNGTDFRVLGIIAAHDRLSANGVGCYASQATLCRKTGIHFTNFSASVTRLVDRAYLRQEAHPTDRRLSVYSVIYNQEDRDIMRRGEDDRGGNRKELSQSTKEFRRGKASAHPKDLGQTAKDRPGAKLGRSTKDQANELGQSTQDRSKVLGRENAQVTENARDPYPNTSCEAGNTSRQSDVIHTPEGAPPDGGGVCDSGNWEHLNDGAQMAIFERRLREGKVHNDNLPRCRNWLEAEAEGREYGDNLRGQAQRLVEEIDAIIEDS
ncbi:MAG: MarR family transcriptional regulator, partial [bacterium]